ncbi:hypothetical protein [Variovorax sp. GB1P17]|uniref:hypothetical protein n=1 Tax=Variovorax sp. GB1P17 TaxID=3443740 RepID=UPI003F460DBD
MWSTLADLFVGLFDFVLDVLLFRGQRRKQGRRTRGVAEDTFEVARFDFVTLVFIGLASAGLMLLLAFGFGLSPGWSVGIGIAVGGIWGFWRYTRLVRE